MSGNIETLTQINLDDLISSFGWQDQPILSRLLRRTFLKPARTFASQMADFDSPVATRGLAEASRLTLRNYVRDIRIFDRDRIPAGPFLALSNHPGMSDTLSLFVALKRADLKIIAYKRPFLKALPNVSKQLFYLTEDSTSRLALIRQVSSHLRSGGAALTFPAGHIEPDPDVHSGAVESLQSWMNSAGIFIRMAPETAILPVVVRGVVWKKAAYHPLTYLKRTRAEREKLAGALQLLAHAIWNVKPVTVRVKIGKPIYADDLGTTNTQIIHEALIAEMESLIRNAPKGQGESAI
ncbi:MAG TPA: hypothetical protein VFO91_00585 [Anaerolineales bacterium]|nr:hypothetical protein [Anaerolineales bacterium]